MSLVAWYKFDGNALDSAGDHHGVVTTENYVNGKIGQALDASTSTIIIANLNDVLNKYNFSFSYWIKPTGTPSSDYRRIIRFLDEIDDEYFYSDCRQAASPYILHFYRDYNHTTWSTQTVISNTQWNTQEWFHIAHVHDNDTFKIYVNGVLSSTTTLSIETEQYKNIKKIEINGSSYTTYLLDDVRIYDHLLSQKEISELSRAKVLHYKLDDNDGIYDSSGNDNHGVNSGSIFTTNSKIGNGAYEFDGTDSLITIPNSSHVQVSGDITISFWLYIQAYSVRTTLIDKAYGGEFTVNIEPGPLLRCYRGLGLGNSAPYSFVNTGTIPMNQWVHACLVVSGTEAKWFIDTVNVGTNVNDNFVGSISSNDVTLGTGYTGGHLDGFLDDVRIYATALSESDILELYQQKASLDEKGSFYTHKLEQISTTEHGTSECYCFANGTVTYTAIYPGTIIYENGIEKVSATSIPQRESFAVTAGSIYHSNYPVHMMDLSSQHKIVPLSLSGYYFGSYSTRYDSSNYYMYSPFKDAVVKVYDNVVGGVDGTPTTTINISAGSSNTYVTPTENNWVIFESDVPIIMSVIEGTGDHMIMPPASTNFYTRRNVYTRTIKNAVPSNVSTYLVSDTDPCISVEIGDGAGGDACQGLGLENLSKTYTWGNVLSDYQLVSPYNNTIDVSYWDGTQWILGESHTLSGTILSPDANFRDGTTGFGSEGSIISGLAINLASDADIWKFEGTHPFLLVVNSSSDDEEIVLGWSGVLDFSVKPSGSLEVSEISEVAISKGLVLWLPLDGHTRDISLNRNDGTNSGAIAVPGIDEQLAYDFDGVDDSITLAQSITMKKESASLSWWMNPSRNGGLFNYRTDGLTQSYDSHVEYRGTSFFCESDRNVNNFHSPSFASFNGTWKMITFVFDQTKVYWYMDGVFLGEAADYGQVNNPTDTSPASGLTDDLILQSISCTTYQTIYQGMLRDIRIYNRALSAEEIKILYDLTGGSSINKMKQTQNMLFVKNQFKEY
jgi:hypothetical protein